ncbi:hypothetical protein SDRG_01336 [Saprolegnia diclina VS20]|uniref:Uncharacterized protein n=1 Tax=Saprolegnia diclina (strain VS20) TaxID=1156394 RepID=T0S825_SAPDV|nr:hypothetical protein SDRG_01336 [Saprolegnia diclina VS20]EQC41363.1 hypothetical protein SDRG_01336 [Saprolegnia diclina VS20]|eukprot:XP_008605077.1 hypothetical protein SDRG_01336 [Saprolegnia diclina VS20]
MDLEAARPPPSAEDAPDDNNAPSHGEGGAATGDDDAASSSDLGLLSTDDEGHNGATTGDEFDPPLDPLPEGDDEAPGDMLTLEASALEVPAAPSSSSSPPTSTPSSVAVDSTELTPTPTPSVATRRQEKRKKVKAKRDVVPVTPGFFQHERAMVALSLKKLRAMRRKAPIQVRIFTAPRRVKTPFDNYVCATSEVVCSDIFWSAIQGNMLRLQHLVRVEGIAVETTADPWMMHQTPLHWAAKGGSREAVAFLLAHGASVYTKDDNGSIPLHLACYAGHAQVAIALLQAGDLKDLLIADYDANLNSLEWATVRGHTQCVRDLIKYTDTVWLPTFVADLIWNIILKTKMKTADEKRAEEKVAAQRAEYQRLQALAEQAKLAASLGEAVVLDRSDVSRVDLKPQ